MIKDIEERYKDLDISVDCHNEPIFYNRHKRSATFHDTEFAQLVEDALTTDIPYLLSLVKKYKTTLEQIRKITPYGMYHEMIDEALKEE